MTLADRHSARRLATFLTCAARLLSIGLATLLPGVAAAQSELTQAPQDATSVTVVTPDFPAGAELPTAGVRVDLTGTVLVERADGCGLEQRDPGCVRGDDHEDAEKEVGEAQRVVDGRRGGAL